MGLGSAEQGRRFAKLLDFPADLLYAGAQGRRLPFPSRLWMFPERSGMQHLRPNKRPASSHTHVLTDVALQTRRALATAH